MALLDVSDLAVVRGQRPLLSGVSFSLEPGEMLGITGESGAGKSLLALAVLDLLPRRLQASGAIRFENQDIRQGVARLRGGRLGYLAQHAEASLDPLNSARAQIEEAIAFSRHLNAPRASINDMLDEVGLPHDLVDRLPYRLGRIERRFAALATALAAEPDLLIADEPVAGLDVVAQRRILDLIARHAAARGMAVILISTDLKAIAAMTQRVLVMREGTVVEAAATADLFSRPQHEHSLALVSALKPRRRPVANAPVGVAAPLLEVKSVSKAFARSRHSPAVLAVDDVSFEVRSAETVGLVGASGSGKSTLLQTVAGLLRTNAGSIVFDRHPHDGHDLPAATRRGIAMTFPADGASLDPMQRIGAIVAEPLRLLPALTTAERIERTARAIETVGFTRDVLDRYPADFTRGARQHIALARALVTQPRLIVLDEPSAGLDVVDRAELMALLIRLKADFSLAYLMAGHDIDMISALSDRVLVMEKGKIIEAGKPGTLLVAAKHDVTRAIIAARLPQPALRPAG